MKREKKKDLNRSVMLHEAWIEDGHTIGKLKHANAFLAERLAEVPEGAYVLNCAPLNLTDTDGAPCRAVLLTEEG